MDAGFLTVVEIGQYFMTNDTAEFSQFTNAVACRGSEVSPGFLMQWRQAQRRE